MDLLKAMQVYVTVVETGSFVAAADRLDTSNAAISRHISALEEHLGARLLNRTTRRLSMTDAGQDFHGRAQQILADVLEAEAITGAKAINPKGLLRISAPLSFGISRLGQWLPGFLARYPDLRLDIDLSDRLVDLATDGIDVAVRIARAPASTNVVSRRIAPIGMNICASPAYLARMGCPASPSDLADHQTLSFSYLATGDAWNLVHRDGTRRPSAQAPCACQQRRHPARPGRRGAGDHHPAGLHRGEGPRGGPARSRCSKTGACRTSASMRSTSAASSCRPRSASSSTTWSKLPEQICHERSSHRTGVPSYFHATRVDMLCSGIPKRAATDTVAALGYALST